MAGFDISAAGNILKTRYLGPIREQLNGSTILLSRIGREDNAVSVSGKSFTVPLHTGRNASAGSGRADGTGGTTASRTTLPTAGSQSYDVAVIPNAYQYGRIQITGPTIAATRDNAGAFVQAVESEIQGLTMDFKKSFNRQLHSDGIDALGYWTTADDTVTSGGSGADLDDNRGNGFIQATAGMLCDVLDVSALPTVTLLNATAAGMTINSVGAAGTATTNVVFASNDGLSGTADGDALILYGTGGNQLMGIAGIIDDGDPAILSGGLHGLAVASKTFWKAQVVEGDTAGTNQALTLERMQKPLDAIAQFSDYDENAIKFLLCSYGVRAKYVAELVKDKRHVNTMELDGGFKAVDFNGIPLVPDPQNRKNTIWYVAPETFKIFRTSDFAWMEKDGAVLSRVQNGDAYEATMFHYGNLGCIARNANGVLTDISE